jgi:plastocyanin
VTFVKNPNSPATDAGRRNTPLRRAGSVVLAATAFVIILAACGGGGGSNSSTGTTAATTGSTAASAPAGNAVSAITVVIQNFAFKPDNFTVTPGATITVKNEDTAPHTLTATNRSFTTGQINPGQTGTVKAPAAAGSYPYFCLIHQFMTGKITVS